jgi:hypothetical protein
VHGGLIMSLTDTLGSLAVASQGQYMTGVSTDISTSFVKPAGKPGDELKMTATLTAMGTYRMFIMEFQSCSAGRLSGRLSHSLFFFFFQENRWRTHGSTSPTLRASWSPTGVGFLPFSFAVCCFADRGLGI